MTTLTQISRLRKQVEAIQKRTKPRSNGLTESEKQALIDRCEKLLAESRRIRAEQEVKESHDEKSLPEPITTVDTAPEVEETLDEFETWLGEHDEN